MTSILIGRRWAHNTVQPSRGPQEWHAALQGPRPLYCQAFANAPTAKAPIRLINPNSPISRRLLPMDGSTGAVAAATFNSAGGGGVTTWGDFHFLAGRLGWPRLAPVSVLQQARLAS